MSYKLKSDLSDEIGSIILANNKLNDAYEILNDVISLIDDGQWTGKSQKVSTALCEICHTYHKKIFLIGITFLYVIINYISFI